jgi:4a-hydroxytetrahydrobiopterin dehydratase
MSDSTPSDPKRKLSGTEIEAAGLTGWTYVLGELATRVSTSDFASALRLVNAIGEAAEAADHHPDLDLRWGRVDVRMSSHDVGGVTSRDVDLARTISGLVEDQGAEQESASVSRYELALDTPSAAGVRGFWAAVQGMKDGGDGEWADLRDPYDRTPTLWFQESGDEEPRQRWHPDVWIDPEQVQARIDAAIEAGGTLVTDEFAPSFWVLADPQGNRMCLCTWQERG